MLIEKYPPPMPHVIVMHQSSNYGEISSVRVKAKGNYSSNNNYSMAPFYIHNGDGKESPIKVNINSAVDYNNYSQQDGDSEQDNFFKSIQGFLVVGKLIGVLPFSGIFGSSWKDLSFRRKSVSAAISYGITTVLIFNATLGCIQSIRAKKRNALEIADSIRATLYSVWGALIYIYFLSRGHAFLKIFQVWNSVHATYSRKDKTLQRDTFMITGAILTSAILENAVLHLEYFKSIDKIIGVKSDAKYDNLTNLETYYNRGLSQWANTLGYNWFLAVLGFVQHKWTLYAWNYMDIAVAVFGRAMYFRFKALWEEAEDKLLEVEGSINNPSRGKSQDCQAWTHVINDHQNLCRILDLLEDFFSPIIFASYAINMFYICLQLLEGLTTETSNASIVHSIYAPWSFLHLVMRAFIVSICCARINVHAHKIRNVFQECPLECYTTEISRVDKRVTAGPDIGLTGLGCFTVTKPFMLSMLSVVFTFEIVLLQCVVPTNPASTPASIKNC